MLNTKAYSARMWHSNESFKCPSLRVSLNSHTVEKQAAVASRRLRRFYRSIISTKSIHVDRTLFVPSLPQLQNLFPNTELSSPLQFSRSKTYLFYVLNSSTMKTMWNKLTATCNSPNQY